MCQKTRSLWKRIFLGPNSGAMAAFWCSLNFVWGYIVINGGLIAIGMEQISWRAWGGVGAILLLFVGIIASCVVITFLIRECIRAYAGTIWRFLPLFLLPIALFGFALPLAMLGVEDSVSGKTWLAAPVMLGIYLFLLLEITAWKRSWIAALACWAMPILNVGMIALLCNSASSFGGIFSDFALLQPGGVAQLIVVLGPWAFVVAFVLEWLVLFYVFAKITQVPFREVVSLRTRVVWGIFILSVVAGVLCTKFSDLRVQEAVKLCEEQTPFSLTAQGLEDAYFREGTEYPDFVPSLTKALNSADEAARAQFGMNYSFFPLSSRSMSQELFADVEQLDLIYHEYDQLLEDALSSPGQPILTHSRADFTQENGVLFNILLPELSQWRSAARREAQKLNLALFRKDKAAALQAYSNLTAISDNALHGFSLISTLVGIACESIRMSSLQLLIESQMLSAQELREIRQSLAVRDAGLPELSKTTFWGECVFGQDIFERIFSGKKFTPDSPPLNVPALRIITPGVYVFFREDQVAYLNHFRTQEMRDEEVTNYHILCSMLLPALNSAKERIETNMSAVYRITMTQAALAEYRAIHGEFPQTLAALSPEILESIPEDPFLPGETLRYAIGDFYLVDDRYLRNPDFTPESEKSEEHHDNSTVSSPGMGMTVSTLGMGAFGMDAPAQKWEKIDGAELVEPELRRTIRIWSVGRNRTDDSFTDLEMLKEQLKNDNRYFRSPRDGDELVVQVIDEPHFELETLEP